MYRLALIISLLSFPALAMEPCKSGDWCLTINFVTLAGEQGSTSYALGEDQCKGFAEQIAKKLLLPDRHPGPHAKDTGASCVLEQ